MNCLRPVFARYLVSAFVYIMLTTPATAQPVPPRAKIVPHRLQQHGHVRTDDYYWLREREDPEVIKYLEAENEYFGAVMAPTETLQEELYQEIRGRIKEADSSAPYRHDRYYYYTRWREGDQYPIHVRKKGSLEAPEEVLLDVNALAEGHKYFRVMNTEVSHDHKLLAYAADSRGRNIAAIRFKDLRAGKALPDVLPNGGWGALAWAADNRTVFYVKKDLFGRVERAHLANVDRILLTLTPASVVVVAVVPVGRGAVGFFDSTAYLPIKLFLKLLRRLHDGSEVLVLGFEVLDDFRIFTIPKPVVVVSAHVSVLLESVGNDLRPWRDGLRRGWRGQHDAHKS